MVGRNILEHESISDFEMLTPTRTEFNLFDYECVSNYLEINCPDYIVHAAGLVGGIQANINHPVDFLVKNFEMGKILLLASRDKGINRVLNLGSSCMYPIDAINPIREESILQGPLEPTNEGYALAKVAVAKLCSYINKENEMCNYKTLIPCNLYGRYDKFDERYSHMIPAVIKKIHEAKIAGEKSVSIWGNGKARREFMYAADFADFIFYAVKNYDKIPQDLNVGLGYDYTINEYYQTIAKIIGYEGAFSHNLSMPIGMKQKLVDNCGLKKIGWEPKFSLEKGIQKVYEYYMEITSIK